MADKVAVLFWRRLLMLYLTTSHWEYAGTPGSQL